MTTTTDNDELVDFIDTLNKNICRLRSDLPDIIRKEITRIVREEITNSLSLKDIRRSILATKSGCGEF